jgi:hypothetical protein
MRRLPILAKSEDHPLLIRVLAGEVAGYRRAPGDYDRWRADHPDFAPPRLPLCPHRALLQKSSKR